MQSNQILLLMAMLIPLAFSPGPGNISCALAASRFGVVRVLPFILGLQVVPFLYMLVMGAGADYLLKSYPSLYTGVRYAGCAYMLYLGLSFFKTGDKHTVNDPQVQGFWHGVLLQIFNTKNITIVVMISSQFITPSNHEFASYLQLGALMILANMSSQLLWALSSRFIMRNNSSGFMSQHINKIYGLMLIATGVLMLW